MKIDVIFDTTVFINESVNEIGLELGLAVHPHRASCAGSSSGRSRAR